MNSRLDNRIFEAVQGFRVEPGASLSDIIAYVDAYEKLILTRDELSGGLQRLIASGQVRETGTRRFVAGKGDGEFEPISEEEHWAAYEHYRAWFRRCTKD